RLLAEAERALPALGARVFQPELAGEVAEVLAHRERGRGEDPGARMVLHLAAEQLGRMQRRDVQLHRLAEGLGPADLLLLLALHQAVQDGEGVPGSARA